MSTLFEEWVTCPRCGEPGAVTTQETDNPSFSCGACPVEVFDSPWVGTIALIENGEGKLLLLRRAVQPQAGLWDLPGGFLTKEETLDECLVREVLEETGLALEEVTYVGNSASTYGGHSSLAVIFKGTVEGDPTLSSENLEFRWWSPEGELPPLAFQDVIHAVDLWRKAKNSSCAKAERNRGGPRASPGFFKGSKMIFPLTNPYPQVVAKMRKTLMFSGIAALLLALPACSGGEREAPLPSRSSLPSVTKTPSKLGLPEFKFTSYDFTYEVQCFCPQRGPIVAEVRDSKLTKATAANGQSLIHTSEVINGADLLTIQEMLASAEEAQAQGKSVVKVEWPVEQGYPDSIFIDRIQNAVDDEVTYAIQKFAVVK